MLNPSTIRADWSRVTARQARRATVLIIVLGVLTILSVMGTAFARFMRTELQSSKFFELKKSVEQLAEDGINFGASKLAVVAAAKHFTGLGNETWPFEATNGRYNFAAGAPPRGYLYSKLDDPLAQVSFRDTLFVDPAIPGGITGRRVGNLSMREPDGDIFRLKVIECQAQLNVRALSQWGRTIWTNVLTTLGEQIAVRAGANPLTAQICAALWSRIDPDNNGIANTEYTNKEFFLDSMRQINEALGINTWGYAVDAITTTSWPYGDFPPSQPNQVRENRDPDGNPATNDYELIRDGLSNNPAVYPGLKEQYNLQRVRMAPINANTAPREVIIAFLANMEAEREYLHVTPRPPVIPWVNDTETGLPRMNVEAGNVDQGRHRGVILNGFPNNAVLKFVKLGPFRRSPPGTTLPNTVDYLADFIMREREIRPFTSFKDFDLRIISRLDTAVNNGLPNGELGLPDPNDGLTTASLGTIGLATGAGVPHAECFSPDWATWYRSACRDMLRAALNPSPKVTKYNPDEAYFDSVDALDVTARVGPFCFHSYGLYEITSLAQIRGPSYDPTIDDYVTRPVAEAQVRAVVKVMDVLRHHTQRDFMTGVAAVNGQIPNAVVPSTTLMSTNFTATYPNSVDETRLYGMHSFVAGRRRGAGVQQPCPEVGYVSSATQDFSPYQLSYYTAGGGRIATTTFVKDFVNTLDIDTATQTPAPFNHRDVANVTGARTFTALNPQLNGIRNFTGLQPDGVLLRGRSRERDRFTTNEYCARYHRLPCGNVNPAGVVANIPAQTDSAGYYGLQARLQAQTNIPFYRGTMEFWCKFNDDWWDINNSQRNAAARVNPLSAYHSDSHFSGLVGATQFLDRTGTTCEGLQMFVFKDVGMQLRIVRMYFGQGYTGRVGARNATALGNIDTMRQHADTKPMDAARVAQNPIDDMGILFARVDSVVRLNSLPFPILPHHWYHMAISWDASKLNRLAAADDEQIIILINGRRCIAGTEVVHMTSAKLDEGLNDGHPDAANPPVLAKSAVILNELNPEDRLTIGCIDRFMLAPAWRGGVSARLFQFAETPANPNNPFRLVATANATLDTFRVTQTRLFANAAPASILSYGRYSPNVNPLFANTAYPTDGQGIFYENGWANPYNRPIQVAWMSWTEYRPRNNPATTVWNNPPVPFAPGPAYQWPRHTLAYVQGNLANPPTYGGSDYVQMFGAITTNRPVGWAAINRAGTNLLNSETYPVPAAHLPAGGPLPPGTPMRRDVRNYMAGQTNLTYYGGMSWQNLILPVNQCVLYRAYFRRGEDLVGPPAPQQPYAPNTTAVLHEVQVGLVTPPRYLEWVPVFRR